MKPIIGIVEWPYLDKDGDQIFEVFNDMVNKVNQHGGIPVGIFPTQSVDYVNKRMGEIPNLSVDESNDLKDVLDRCDAVIKPGALRIYGYERLIYDYAVQRNMPFLGICAGMQLMANYGNKEFMNNERNIPSDISHQAREEYAHYVNILKGSLLSEILKEERILVNSKHNYHVRSSGILVPAALSDDGIIEAIEKKDQLFSLGLQWHPELLKDVYSDLIFDRFVESAKIKKR